mmetsp:Transcript_27949/g.83574  ORF Transcript_27949/g.83574 Transcript_27949/m.83574 type:complete len:211 (-) Transcript_27949:120-752(-)
MAAEGGATQDAAGAMTASAAPEAGQVPVITEVEAGRLLAGLEQLHADYEQTLAAGRRAAERPANALTESDSEGGSEPHEAAADGYVALGSDSDSDAHSDASGAQAGAVLQEPGTLCPAAGPQGCEVEGAPGAGPRNAAVMEDFADFSDRNPALPPPPAPPPQLAATPLTAGDVQLIKQTMLKVSPPPPRWAEDLSDDKLERMVKELTRST